MVDMNRGAIYLVMWKEFPVVVRVGLNLPAVSILALVLVTQEVVQLPVLSLAGPRVPVHILVLLLVILANHVQTLLVQHKSN